MIGVLKRQMIRGTERELIVCTTVDGECQIGWAVLTFLSLLFRGHSDIQVSVDLSPHIG